jgi:hypothetical protein
MLVMRFMYGGQMDDADFHYAGLYEELMTSLLRQAGFDEVSRVDVFGLFADASAVVLHGRPISLNMLARKAREDEDEGADA